MTEMGGPYPQERGGVPRVLSQMGAPQVPDDTRIVHPVWAPRAPRALSQRTIALAQALDRALNAYQRA